MNTTNFTKIAIQINKELKEKGFNSKITSIIQDNFNIDFNPKDDLEKFLDEVFYLTIKHMKKED